MMFWEGEANSTVDSSSGEKPSSCCTKGGTGLAARILSCCLLLLHNRVCGRAFTTSGWNNSLRESYRTSNKDFKVFKGICQTLKQKSLSTLAIRDGWMAIRRTFVLEQLKELTKTSRWLREDYKEAADNAYSHLGCKLMDIKFRKQGAFHWMANIMHFGKMLFFSW